MLVASGRAADRVACTCGEGAKIVAMDSAEVLAVILVRGTLPSVAHNRHLYRSASACRRSPVPSHRDTAMTRW